MSKKTVMKDAAGRRSAQGRFAFPRWASVVLSEGRSSRWVGAHESSTGKTLAKKFPGADEIAAIAPRPEESFAPIPKKVFDADVSALPVAWRDLTKEGATENRRSLREDDHLRRNSRGCRKSRRRARRRRSPCTQSVVDTRSLPSRSWKRRTTRRIRKGDCGEGVASAVRSGISAGEELHNNKAKRITRKVYAREPQIPQAFHSGCGERGWLYVLAFWPSPEAVQVARSDV